MNLSSAQDGSTRREPPPLGGALWLFGPFVVAFLAALFGTYWDDAWHTERGRDSFLIAPHVTLYAGIALTGGLIFLWLAFVARERGVRAALRHPPLTVAALGVAVTLAAGPIDNIWHALFGRDAVVWSPPHMLGIAGVIAAAAAFSLELSRLPGRTGRLLGAIAGAALLAAITVVVLEYETDVPQFDEVWYLPVLAAGAALALGMVRANEAARFAATAAAAVYTVILAAFQIALDAADLPGPAVPALVIPALALDLAHRHRLSPLPTATAFVAALYAAYLPYLNLLRDDVRLEAADVAIGAPLAVAAAYVALRAVTPVRGAPAAVPAAAALVFALGVALTSSHVAAPPAAAHDPGQGTEIAKAAVEVTADGRRLGLDARLQGPDGCRDLEPVAVVARRAGESRRASLGNPAPCEYRGSVVVPDRGRWFVYAELRRADGRSVETWLPIAAGESGRRDDANRSVYLPPQDEGSAAKRIAGVAMYAAFAALLAAVVFLHRRAQAQRARTAP